jgi:hypothetical protein
MCSRDARTLWVVELKNSCLSELHIQTPEHKSMAAPFQDLSNCLLWQFIMQTACTFVLFERTFPTLAATWTCLPTLLVMDQKTQLVSEYRVDPKLVARVRQWLTELHPSVP